MSHQQGVREEILRLLFSAHPGVATPSALEEYTSRYSSRIGELRREGWDIETVPEVEGHRAGYRLRSRQQGKPDVTHAGCVIRHSAVEGWQVRTHREALDAETVPPEVLARAADAALAAYLAVVSPHLPEPEPDWADDFFSIFNED